LMKYIPGCRVSNCGPRYPLLSIKSCPFW
jgi:hypothetical protein